MKIGLRNLIHKYAHFLKNYFSFYIDLDFLSVQYFILILRKKKKLKTTQIILF